ncbi:MAG: hypothetical protein ACRC3B_16315 [Bacteroidia bacterium]
MSITSAELSATSNVTVQLTNRTMPTYYILERGETIDLQQTIPTETLFSLQPNSTGVSILTLLFSENNSLILDKDQSPDWENGERHNDDFTFVFKKDKARISISLTDENSKIIIVGTVPTP